jgi:hypothetical protein
MGQEVFDVFEEVLAEDEWTVVLPVYEDDELVKTAVMVAHGFDVVDAAAVAEVEEMEAADQVEEQVLLLNRKTEW